MDLESLAMDVAVWLWLASFCNLDEGSSAGFACKQRAILGSIGHYRCPTSGRNAAAKMSEPQARVGEAGLARPSHCNDDIRL